jgi:hypothetical protein
MSKMETRRQGGKPPADRVTNMRKKNIESETALDRLLAIGMIFGSSTAVGI